MQWQWQGEHPADVTQNSIGDVVKGRPTEINQMNGFVVEKAGEVGIDAPVNASITDAIRAIDAGALKPSADNIELVLSRAGF